MKRTSKFNWMPTKYELQGSGWAVSSDVAHLSPASTISASLALTAAIPALRDHARGDLADVGCGTAPFFGAYRDHVDSVCWIDWPSSPHQTRHLDIVADLNKPLRVEEHSFDTILASSVLEHIWRHDVFLDEITRTLRPGGKIILIVPFMYWLHEEPHDYFRWTRHALTRACEERGLQIDQLDPYGGGLDLVADLAVRAVASVSLGLAKLVGRPLARLLSAPRIRRVGRVAREKLPLGYILVASKPGM